MAGRFATKEKRILRKASHDLGTRPDLNPIGLAINLVWSTAKNLFHPITQPFKRRLKL